MKKKIIALSFNLIFTKVFAFDVVNVSSSKISFLCQPSNIYFILDTGNRNSCQNNDVSIKYGTFPINPDSVVNTNLKIDMKIVPKGTDVIAGLLPSDIHGYYFYATVDGINSSDTIYFQQFSSLLPTGHVSISL